MEDEAGDVVPECKPGDMVDARVLAGVDAAETGLLRSGAEAAERAGHAGQCRRGEREVLLVAVKAGEDVGSGGADGAMRAGVGGIGGSVAGEREPVRVADGVGVAVGVGEADRRDRPPELVRVLGVVEAITERRS